VTAHTAGCDSGRSALLPANCWFQRLNCLWKTMHIKPLFSVGYETNAVASGRPSGRPLGQS